MPALPAYEHELAATHQAFARDFAAAMMRLEFPPARDVLDLACGDGFFTRLLASRFPHSEKVFAIDKSVSFVEMAEAKTRDLPQVEVGRGDAYSLPFARESIDVVWCAESLISLDHRDVALAEIHRVLRHEGYVAILEQDQAHELILPWPPDLEPAIQQAMWERSLETQREGFVARTLRAELEAAGFKNIRRATTAVDRAYPLDGATRTFLEAALARLDSQLADYLVPEDRRRLEALADPDEPGSFLHRRDLEFTFLFWIWTALKP